MLTKRTILDVRPLRAQKQSQLGLSVDTRCERLMATRMRRNSRKRETRSRKKATRRRRLDAPNTVDALDLEDALLRLDGISWRRNDPAGRLRAGEGGGRGRSAIARREAETLLRLVPSVLRQLMRHPWNETSAKQKNSSAPGARGRRSKPWARTLRACARARRCRRARGPTCSCRRARTSTWLLWLVVAGWRKERGRKQRASVAEPRDLARALHLIAEAILSELLGECQRRISPPASGSRQVRSLFLVGCLGEAEGPPRRPPQVDLPRRQPRSRLSADCEQL